uniref:Uncharacterized protein n=1 Tax=Amazona collaria TaxID=241587 RepID=A0A8B9GC99_9PSIT
MLRTPELHTILQVRSHKSRVEGQDHLPRPAGHAPCDAAQDSVAFQTIIKVLQGREENQDHQVHPASRDCLVDQDQLERMESLENQGQKVISEDLDSQALRVKMVSQVNVVHRVLQDLLEQEVGQVLLVQKVPRVLLDLLVPLEAQGCLAYRECLEKEELLEVLDQKGIRENLVAKVLTAFLVQEERG